MFRRLLRDRDYTFIVARCPGSFSRNHSYFQDWINAQHLAIELAQKCNSFDSNGIVVYFASKPYSVEKHTNPQALANAFQVKIAPQATDLFGSLQAALQDYFHRRDAHRTENGEIILVFLDQVPPDEQDAIARLLIESSQKIPGQTEADSDYELGVSFIQIGSDPTTQAFLEFLDNDLVKAGAKHDIVDSRFWYTIKVKAIEQVLIDALLD